MGLHLGPGRDPALEQFLLLLAQLLLRGRGRHHRVGVRGKHAGDQLALVGMAGGNAFVIGLDRLIEAELGLAGFLVGAVAFEAVAGQDGTHFAAQVGVGNRLRRVRAGSVLADDGQYGQRQQGEQLRAR